MEEAHKRTMDDTLKNYMGHLNDQWEAALVVFKTRIENLNKEFKECDAELKKLKSSLKSYKKTFNECSSCANDAIRAMNDRTNQMYQVLSKYPEDTLNKVLKICEVIEEGRYS